MAGHLVVVEAGGKQSFVFATNKRREAVGASQLIHLVGNEWLDEAIEGRPGVEVLVRASGTATLLVDDPGVGREVVTAITKRALISASGLDVYGYVTPRIDLAHPDDVRAAQRDAFQNLAYVRGQRPGPALRHQRIPFVADCATSSMPSAGLISHHGGAPEPRSRQALDKLAAANDALKRIAEMLGTDLSAIRNAADRLEKSGDGVAVVHADGNGLGKIFTEFDSGAETAEQHIASLRSFSAAVDQCSRSALLAAVSTLGANADQVLPLIVGGDDLTLLCPAGVAIELTEAYLGAFARETGTHDGIRSITRRMLGHDHLTAAAGIAVVKSHYPFSQAYELAELLCSSAKGLLRELDRTDLSALDFHVVLDSSSSILEAHRELGDDKRAVRRPALVDHPRTDGEDPSTLPEGVCSLDDLRSAAEIVGRKEDSLPRSIWYQIRGQFDLSAQAADDLYQIRMQERGLRADDLFGPSLFGEDGSTMLGDALDLIDIAGVDA